MTATPGCVLGKVLGTAAKNSTRMSVDLRRWAIFAAWESEDAYAAFLEDSSVMKRWNAQATSVDHYKLRPLRSRGTWAGIDPFEGLEETPAKGEIAVLTRTAVRSGRWIQSVRAIPPVDASLWRQPGCSMAVGMGEVPIGQQATFSIWDSTEAMQAFARKGAEHAEAMRRSHKERWHTEGLFTRFEILDPPRPDNIDGRG